MPRVKLRPGVIASLLVAALGGPAMAVAIAAPGTDATPAPVTIGSTTGTPSVNVPACSACTYVPHNSVDDPALKVPANGAVTSFSVNSGSAGGTVELRVLRPDPAHPGQFTGAGTSPAETLVTGPQTFAVSMPVKSGDVLGLDNDSQAILFDTSSGSPITAFYQPHLADGATAAPNNTMSGLRLLLSAVVQPAATTTTGTGTNPGTPPPPQAQPPSLTHVTQSHRVWRLGSKRASVSLAHKSRPPVGTTFSFTLDQAGVVRLSFSQRLPGRKIGGNCVGQKPKNRHKPRCTRLASRGALSLAVGRGSSKVSFQGRISKTRKLRPGNYQVTIAARNATGKPSQNRTLKFTIAR
jgi:hypothetical protein